MKSFLEWCISMRLSHLRFVPLNLHPPVVRHKGSRCEHDHANDHDECEAHAELEPPEDLGHFFEEV